jgi:hypothetical protein
MVPAYILRSSKHAPTALAYPFSCCSIFSVSTSSSVNSVPSSCKFLWPYVFPILAGLRLGSVTVPVEPAHFSYLSCSWSVQNKKIVFVSMNKITLGLTDLLHQDPLNSSKKHRDTPLSVHACYSTCRYGGLSVCSDARMLALAKARIGLGWD